MPVWRRSTKAATNAVNSDGVDFKDGDLYRLTPEAPSVRLASCESLIDAQAMALAESGPTRQAENSVTVTPRITKVPKVNFVLEEAGT